MKFDLEVFKRLEKYADISPALTGGDPEEERLRMEARWYESLAKDAPDYSIYEGEAYLYEGYICWKVYSRMYINYIKNLEFGGVDHVLDVGNGIGYSTLQLQEQFKVVEGTNVEGSLQWEMNQAQGIRLHPDYIKTDLIFASEYFEHFSDPNEELKRMLDISQPKHIVFANTFTGDSSGHFKEYNGEGRRKAQLSFNKILKANGYNKFPTWFWNGKPSVWSKGDVQWTKQASEKNNNRKYFTEVSFKDGEGV